MKTFNSNVIYLPTNINSLDQASHPDLEVKGVSTSGYYFDSLGLPLNHGFTVPDASRSPHSVPIIPEMGEFLPTKLKKWVNETFEAYIRADWENRWSSVQVHQYGFRFYTLVFASLMLSATGVILVIVAAESLFFL